MESSSTDWIAAPSEATFQASFDGIAPPISFLESPLGKIAFYLLKGDDSIDSHPIIFIHGSCTPALGLLPIAKELQKRKYPSHILLFDLWGHGLSSSPRSPHSPALVNNQILSLMSHLHWSEAHFVGYSLGGSLAVNFAAVYHDAVVSLFLIAPAGLLGKEHVPANFAADDLKEIQRDSDKEKHSRRRIWEWLEGSSSVVVPADWKEQINRGQLVASALRQWQLDHHAGHLGSIASFLRNSCVFGSNEAFKKVANTAIPTLAILGELDNLSTPALLDSVGMHTYTVISDATHGLARDNVPEIVDCLVKFLGKL